MSRKASETLGPGEQGLCPVVDCRSEAVCLGRIGKAGLLFPQGPGADRLFHVLYKG